MVKNPVDFLPVAKVRKFIQPYIVDGKKLGFEKKRLQILEKYNFYVLLY
jgi:hypothetical protein